MPLLVLSHVVGNPAWAINSVLCLGSRQLLVSRAAFQPVCLAQSSSLLHYSLCSCPACWVLVTCEWNSITPARPNKPSGAVFWRKRALGNVIMPQAVSALPGEALMEPRQDPLPSVINEKQNSQFIAKFSLLFLYREGKAALGRHERSLPNPCST